MCAERSELNVHTCVCVHMHVYWSDGHGQRRTAEKKNMNMRNVDGGII
jgi:hypothetical protein